MMTRYTPDMRYGAHADAAFLQLGDVGLRSDLSCTIFLSDPASYEGGALRIQLGTRELPLQGRAGQRDRLPVRHAARGRAGDRRASGWSRSPSSRAGSPTRSAANCSTS